LPEVALETIGDVGIDSCHARSSRADDPLAIEREAGPECTAYKVLNGISAAV
jgi:hypothetical protein